MDSEELSEDEILDLTSDSMFLESLLQEMRKALAIPVAQVF
jgi:Rod binding domain-containing protein